MHLVFTRMTGEISGKQLRSLLLCLCDVLGALINYLFADSEQVILSAFVFHHDSGATKLLTIRVSLFLTNH